MTMFFRNRLAYAGAVVWLLLTVSLAIWWLVFGLGQARQLQSVGGTAVTRVERVERMLVWEGIVFVGLLLTGGMLLVVAIRRESARLMVEWVQTVASARACLTAGSWDLAIVDVKLPDGSGFGLARQIKKLSVTPVLFMTALNSAENRLEGFEPGADEYLPKPFHLKEFILRVRRMLATHRPCRTIATGGLVVDFDRLTVERPGGRKTRLQVRDSRVLKLLIDAAPRAVDNAIVRLRQALGDDESRLIQSVRGIGYRWTGGGEE